MEVGGSVVVAIAALVGEVCVPGLDELGKGQHAVVRLTSNAIAAMLTILKVIVLAFFCIVVLHSYSVGSGGVAG